MENQDSLSVILECSKLIDGLNERYLEKVEEVEKRNKASNNSDEINMEISQELKLNAELKARLAELTESNDEIEKKFKKFALGPTIADSDRQRLETAKEIVDIGKKLTGVRFIYNAPPDVVCGYIKYERDRTLTPFEIPADEDVESRLWAMLGNCAAQNPEKPNQPKEESDI